ncbi:MAG: autotransporter domain-containing protein [Verrucomicrobia bacterium]|nr:autotransporter domain-containing protein [Verrucomicrobiota bacterium]
MWTPDVEGYTPAISIMDSISTRPFWWIQSYDTSREALIGTATGNTDGEEFSTFLGAGYNFHFGSFTVGPTGQFNTPT